jgi:Holliday junction DNA helicase RuvA
VIGLLRGTLRHKEPPVLLVDVGGVGYELEAPMTAFYELPALGEPVTLYTHLVVREDAQLLYGFVREGQRRLFRSLLKVNGVGPRVALAVLSGLSDEELLRCLTAEDVARLTKVPGVGRKTAERLIVELRDKLPSPAVASETRADPADEAVQALQALGYRPAEASRMVSAVPAKGLATEEIIRQALKGVAT